jgi:hypothetical protein
MKLFHIKQKLDFWLKGAPPLHKRAEPHVRHDDSQRMPSSASPTVSVVSQKLVHSDIKPQRRQDRGNTSKVIEWRRRVLIRKGARMHAAMLERSDDGSLAMLDACGVVVYWCERPAPNSASDAEPSVLKRHVSQFYVPEDIDCSVPLLHLRNAATSGSSTQRGWRKRADGTTFWATTVIEALSLRSGSLQGFSHIVRESKDPWVTKNADSVRQLQQRGAETLWQPRDGAYGSLRKGAGVQ